MQRSNLTNALSFSVIQDTTHCETKLLSKQLYFQSRIDYNKMRDFCRKIFFRIPSCLEQLLPSYKYFLFTAPFLISYFSNRHSYCFRRAFSPVKVIIQSMYFFEGVLILNSYFFRGGTFLGAGISWKSHFFDSPT